MASSASTTPASATLANAQDQFIALWGQMGSSWGIPRTMAEVHALLFITGRALTTDDVMARLHISRGNASMTLRSLVDWGIAARMHQRGDRKEYFSAEQDVWKLFRTILRERKKREVDPMLESLKECRELTASLASRRAVDPVAAEVQSHNRRLDDMMRFIKTVDAISERFIHPTSGKGLQAAAKLLAKVS
jgi:DNA-binding transcriptional regulator GbsR (MarR family)